MLASHPRCFGCCFHERFACELFSVINDSHQPLFFNTFRSIESLDLLFDLPFHGADDYEHSIPTHDLFGMRRLTEITERLRSTTHLIHLSIDRGF